MNDPNYSIVVINSSTEEKMSAAKKRSVTDMLEVSPTKAASSRKKIVVKCACVGDDCTGVLYPYIEGRPEVEPNTNPARMAIAEGKSNLLRSQGFFMHASWCKNANSDEARRSNRGYDQKAFLFLSDEPLATCKWEELKKKGQTFCDVSIRDDCRILHH